MLYLTHKKLDVYEVGLTFVTDIYKVTQDFPGSEKFALCQQIRRAAVSIVSNIAEGSSRKSIIERKRFYEIARGSLIEIDAQLEISIRLGFITKVQFDGLNLTIVRLFQMLSKMISL